MQVPQAFQYQGSKRILAPKILRYLPSTAVRLVEPFCGSAAVSCAYAAKDSECRFWLNDINGPLSLLLDKIINSPNAVANKYESIWYESRTTGLQHYYNIRTQFNQTRDPTLLLYLLARCVKGSVRYNQSGAFNQSPDKRRLGTHPDRMRANLERVSLLLHGRSEFTRCDYRDVLTTVRKDDIIYMDPPYQGVCGTRDHRYLAGIDFDEFVACLDSLNQRGIRYLMSYDGRLGTKRYGKGLPQGLELKLIEIEAGRSTQATFLGRSSKTVESLYISQRLVEELSTQKLEATRRLQSLKIQFA